MSDPIPPNNPNSIVLLASLLGGFLTIIGGFFATIINSRVQKKNEIDYIKTSLIDELHEICTIITRINDTYKTTHIVPNSYLNDLQNCTDSFKYHKQRLFLIRNEELRREVVKFYKDLGESIAESINKVGKLGEAQVDTTHDKIVNEFTTIQATASAIKEKIRAYKYHIFWFC